MPGGSSLQQRGGTDDHVFSPPPEGPPEAKPKENRRFGDEIAVSSASFRERSEPFTALQQPFSKCAIVESSAAELFLADLDSKDKIN